MSESLKVRLTKSSVLEGVENSREILNLCAFIYHSVFIS